MLDISEMAGLLGYPTCDPARFVADPEFGTIMPNASMLLPNFNFTPPMQQYESMYPFYALPHYESLNAGARGALSAWLRLPAHSQRRRRLSRGTSWPLMGLDTKTAEACWRGSVLHGHHAWLLGRRMLESVLSCLTLLAGMFHGEQ